MTDLCIGCSSAVLVGGRELPFESLRATSRLDLFDLDTHAWLESYDVDGTFASRIGHSVVTVGDNVYAFGGERLGLEDPVSFAGDERPSYLNDVHELSFRESVLRCRELWQSAAPQAGDALSTSAPCERAWHASARVQYAAASSSAEDHPKDDAVLVLGGRDASGKFLSDVWVLVLDTVREVDPATPEEMSKAAGALAASSVSPRWIQLTPTGASPLPLAYHNAVSLNDDGSRVVVLGGKQLPSPSAAMLADVFVLDLAANAWSTLALSPSPLSSPSTENLLASSLTARCCATALSLVLPIDASSGKVVLFSDDIAPDAVDETHAKLARDVVLIYGGYSIECPAIPTTSCVLLDVASSAVRELVIPNAGLQSYMGHASATTCDRQAMFVFGGVDPHTSALLDATSALHFWRPQPLVDGLEDDATVAANANPIKTKRYANGDVYVGEVLAVAATLQTSLSGTALRHGHGKCTYANGDVYDGQWERDERCGQGTMTYSNGDVFVGAWMHDQRHGYGIHRRSVASDSASSKARTEVTHDGYWRHDSKCGSGTATYSDGSQLTATWEPDGSAVQGRIERFDDGNGECSYTGNLSVDGVPEGNGMSEHAASGETYTGQWLAGRRSGHGIATLRDGTMYTGAWRNGKRNGVGTCMYARTRDVYCGKWVGNMRCGRGVCTYANGSTYDGEWKDDQCHGHGRFTFASGVSVGASKTTFYEGSWRANRFCGDGALVLNVSSDQELDSVEAGEGGGA